MPASRMRLTGAVALAVVASGLLLPSPAHAVSGVFISELHYDDSTTNDAGGVGEFVEITAPAGTDLTGWKVQLVNGNGNAVYRTDTLTATVGDQVSGWGTAVLTYPTSSGGVVQNGSPDGVALLDAAGSVVEFISYEGPMTASLGTPATTVSSAETGAAVESNATAGDQTLQRQVDGSWTGPVANTKGVPNGFTTTGDPDPEPLEATSPGDQTGTVGVKAQPVTLTATGGTAPYSWAFTGLPAGLDETEDGVIGGAPTTAGGPVTVTATVTDDDGATDDVTFTYTVADQPEAISIAEVQGTGARSPFAPPTGNGSGTDTVTVTGVVTARYATGGFNGMYIQTPGVDTEDASDGVFVYAGSGNNNIPSGVDLGDSVIVSGTIAEFNLLTQVVPASAAAVGELVEPLGTVEAKEAVFPATDAERELLEGELIVPDDAHYTVTNNYNINTFAEIGLAVGETPLRQPTEYVSPHDPDGINAIKAENAARSVLLDDGASLNYMTNSAAKNQPLPWLSPTNAIRVGAEVTFTGPVVLDWRNNAWKFQPTHPVTDTGADVATFEDTRAQNLVPRDVLGADGDLKIATFNVLNYFNTTGEAYVAAGPQQTPPIVTHCTYYTDRAGARIGNDQCGVKQPGETYTSSNPNDGRGPRGAATAASLARQEDKLARTINTLDADVVGLEEVENSIKLPGETNRDDALANIVAILNEDAGEQKWAFVKSPGEALTAAAVAEQDVIRGAFIYQRDSVQPVGQSDLLFGTTQFANAREPLAQAFKAKGAPDSDAFAVIVNHFKSKGDNASPAPPATGDNANDTETGVGAFNGDRVRQAQRLVQFADDFAADREIDAVFLAGDFNAYTMEDPITTLEDGGYELVDSTDPEDESYSYSGMSGSLDHVLANEAAMDMVRGADIWEINADESVAFQYSRYNYNATDFWQPDLPFATSDHNPEIVGIDVPDFEPRTYREIQVLGTNDFHGRLVPDGGNAAGAAPFATAVEELKAQVPDSIFVAAGDLVGASTFESFIQEDDPTIDALNEMGLEVSAAGNHEFDRGYEDFVGRIQDRAEWEYIAANVNEPAGRDDLNEVFTKTFGTGEEAVTVGFVGAVTEDLPALVNPSGIDGVTVADVVDSTNAAAADLKADGADLVILLVHEGSPSTQCSSASFTDAATTWGNIVQNTSSDVDAIVSGHTHLAYNCRFPVADWVTEGRAVTKRPVVSAGQYGTNLNQLVFKYDMGSGKLAAISQDVVATAGVGYAPDPEVKAIVDEAVAYAETAGAEVLGEMDGPFNRAQYLPASGATENRGGESTLGNQVAEVQRWATDTDIAFMNPGGLRADMVGTPAGGLRDLTYRQAADVQPFANTLVNMQLTGEQLETVLEQQWQRNAQGGVPSRPFLRLGVSEGFTYTYEETPQTVNAPNAAPVETFKGEVTGMWLDGEPIDPDATYGVTVNSFLSTGGDNFWELANGADRVDTGKVDLEAMVDYMEQYDEVPLEVDYSQRAVEVKLPNVAPETYVAGGTVQFDVSSWSMSAPGDVQDSAIDVEVDGEPVSSATLNNATGALPYDTLGRAAVSFTVPAGVTDESVVTLTGAQTGTEVIVPVRFEDGLVNPELSAEDATMTFGQAGEIEISVLPADAEGTVTVSDGIEDWSATIEAGTATVTVPAGALTAGVHDLTIEYSGQTGVYSPSSGSVTMTVQKATPTLTVTPTPASVQTGQTSSIAITVGAEGFTPTGLVDVSVNGDPVSSQTLTNGAATAVVGPFATPGERTISVTYAGDDSTASRTTTTVVTVVAVDPPPGPQPVATTTTATAAPMVYGTAGSVAVTVSSTKTLGGAVQLLDGSTVIASGTVSGTGGATLAIPGTALAVGSHALTVKYLGNADNNPSQGSVQVTVDKASSASQVAVTPPEIEVGASGASAQVSVTAAGFVPTGEVQVRLDGDLVGTVTLANGSASVALPALTAAGSHTVTASYAGDANAKPSQSSATLTGTKAEKAEASVSVNHNPKTVRVDKTRVTITVRVSGDDGRPTGSVRIRVAGQGVEVVELVNGKATRELKKFDSVGQKSVSVTYLGDDAYKTASAEHTIKVVKKKKK